MADRQDGKEQRFRPLPYGEVPAFLEKLRADTGTRITRLACELLILTLMPSRLVLQAETEEFDLGAGVWKIAPRRAGEDLRIPLSPAAVTVIKRARLTDPDPRYLFPGRKGVPITNMTLVMLLRRLGVRTTPTGLRLSCLEWAEATGRPTHAARMLLNLPAIGEEPNISSDALFVEQRQLLSDWAAFLQRS